MSDKRYMPSYIFEYADDTKRSFRNNNLMKAEIKKELIRRVDAVIRNFGKGRLTVDETMYSLATVAKEGFECW